MNKIVNIEPLSTVDPREASLDKQTASLVESIRNSLTAQTEMFCRILDGSPKDAFHGGDTQVRDVAQQMYE